MSPRILPIIILALFIFSCSQDKKVQYEPVEKEDAYQLYKEGIKAFDERQNRLPSFVKSVIDIFYF